jgi:hypothetical protein
VVVQAAAVVPIARAEDTTDEQRRRSFDARLGLISAA